MPRFELTDQFFEDEVREGFYIPSAIKKAWGAELRVLNEIDSVCCKLGIKYFATWGTFLGAVRHGGYVPWDDDLDICMLRDDYNRFLEEGVPLLPKGYEIYDHKSRGDHIKFAANVVARSRICYEEDYLKEFHGFPYIAGVDLFQLDYMSPDPKEHEIFRLKSMLLQKVAGDIVQGKLEENELKEQLEQLTEIVGIEIPKGLGRDEIRQFLDIKTVELFSYYVDKKELAEKVVQMMPCGIWDDDFYILPAKYYKTQVELPFETGKMPVALYYEPAIRKHYKDYMKVFKGGGAHNYPFFSSMENEMQELSGHTMPEYHVDPSELTDRRVICCKDASGNKDTYRTVVMQCLKEMEMEHVRLKDEKDPESIAGICADLQQLAIDLGTYMEAVKGEGYDIVTMLEKYCEGLYEFAQNEALGSLETVDNLFQEIYEKVSIRKEVLFLPFKGEYWEVFDEEYNKCLDSPDTDVYVAPIPYYYKDHLGQLYDKQYELSKYPEDLLITNYDDYELAFRNPDRIYIQNPYDRWNEITSVPPFFYSDNLLKYTDCLVYIPWFRTYDFTAEDQKAWYNMKYYCNVPGVINADKVIVQSKIIREAYIAKLCEFTGDESREIWEQKIIVTEPVIKEREEKKEERMGTILYYQDFSDILLYGQHAVEKLKIVAERMAGEQGYIILKSGLIDDKMKEVEPELYYSYCDMLKEVALSETITVIDEKDADIIELIADCSSFYGDAGRIAHMFDEAGKQVEIQDYEEG